MPSQSIFTTTSAIRQPARKPSATCHTGFAYTYRLVGALTSETCPDGRALATSYETASCPATLSGSKSGSNANYITQTRILAQRHPMVFRPRHRANRRAKRLACQRHQLSHASARKRRAIGNGNVGFLFISCPNWGVKPSNYGTNDICLHARATNDNGNVQSYSEYHADPAIRPVPARGIAVWERLDCWIVV
jgi:hypothetical protein